MAAGGRQEHRSALVTAALAAVAAMVGSVLALAPLPTFASHAATASLEGYVHSAISEVVAGATIDLLEQDTQNVVATADTDADGHYAVAADPGTYDVRVLLPGTGVRARQTTPAVVLDGETHLDVVVQHDLVPVTGTVRDVNGALMPDMGVIFFNGIGGTGEHTDENGAFIAYIAPGHYDLEVRPGVGRPFIGSVRVPVVVEPGTPATFDLRFPMRSVTLNVDDASGNPAPDVWVRAALSTTLVVEDVLPGVDGTGVMWANATTDTAGTAHLPVVVTNTPIPLEFTPPSNALYGRSTATVPSGATTLDVTLPPTHAVKGVVRDAAGQPVPNAQLGLAFTSGESAGLPVAFGSTDAGGSYEMRATAGDYVLSTGTNATSGTTSSSVGVRAGVTVPSGADVVQDLTLPATEPVAVTVTNADGTVVADAWVTVRSDTGVPYPGVGTSSHAIGKTDASGVVQLGRLAGDVDVIVTAQRPGGTGFATEDTFSDPGPSVTVAFEPTTTITGVLTLGGEPVASGPVAVSSSFGYASTTTGPDGSFTLAAPAGNLNISASTPFPATPNFSLNGPLTVPPEGRHVLLDVPTSEVTLRNAGTFSALNIGGYAFTPPGGLGFAFADGEAGGMWGLFVSPPSPEPVVAEAVASPVTRIHTSPAPLFTDLSVPRTLLFMHGVADDVPPTITATVSPEPNADGWNQGPVTVSFNCADDGFFNSCSSPVTVSDATSGQTVTGVVVDSAGNRTKTSVVVKIDDAAPSISAVPGEQPNGAGWYKGDVSFTFACDDDRSGVAGCPDPVTLTGEGTDVSAERTVYDAAGNSASATAVADIDRTPPTIGVTVEPAVPTSGWYTSGPVTVTFDCSDALSGIVSCPSPVNVTSEGSTTVDGVATDAAGWTAKASVTVRIDATPPSGTPQYPNGAVNGWYTTAVTVPISCSDTLSGVGSCPSASFTTEGAAQQASVTIADVAGNTAGVLVSGINVDLAAPDTALSSSSQLRLTAAQPLSGTASDSASGVSRVVVEFASSNGRTVSPVEATLSCSGSGGGGNSCTWTAPAPGRGRYTVKATAYDLAGRADPTPATGSVIA